jgi:hypothetical protein
MYELNKNDHENCHWTRNIIFSFLISFHVQFFRRSESFDNGEDLNSTLFTFNYSYRI